MTTDELILELNMIFGSDSKTSVTLDDSWRPLVLSKARRMPIGTVSRGRKKVAEGKWVQVPKSTREGACPKLPPISSLAVVDLDADVLAGLPDERGTQKKGDVDTGTLPSGLRLRTYDVTGIVYRGVSVADYERIRKQGFIDTDMRGAITEDEGTNLTHEKLTAVHYLPHDGKGLVLAIDVSKLKTWGIAADRYIRTSEKIPLSAVVGVSPILDNVKKGQRTKRSGMMRRVSFYYAGIEILEAGGKPEEAKKWRDRIELKVREDFPDSEEAAAIIEAGKRDRKEIEENKRHMDVESLLKSFGLLGAPLLLKAKRMPIGTVSRGRKKVAEGKWVDVKKGPTRKMVIDPSGIAESFRVAATQVAEEKQKYGAKLDGLPIGTKFSPKGKHTFTLTDLGGDKIWIRDDGALGHASGKLLEEFGRAALDSLLASKGAVEGGWQKFGNLAAAKSAATNLSAENPGKYVTMSIVFDETKLKMHTALPASKYAPGDWAHGYAINGNWKTWSKKRRDTYRNAMLEADGAKDR